MQRIGVSHNASEKGSGYLFPVNLTVPSDIQAGDLMILVIEGNYNGSVPNRFSWNGSSDWTVSKELDYTSFGIQVFHKYATNSEPSSLSVTCNSGSNHYQMALLVYRQAEMGNYSDGGLCTSYTKISHTPPQGKQSKLLYGYAKADGGLTSGQYNATGTLGGVVLANGISANSGILLVEDDDTVGGTVSGIGFTSEFNSNGTDGTVFAISIAEGNSAPEKPSSFTSPINGQRVKAFDKVVVSWDEVVGGVTYELDFYNGSEWNNVSKDLNKPYTTFVVPPFTSEIATAKFRVKAVNEFGSSDYLESDVFTVEQSNVVMSGGSISESAKYLKAGINYLQGHASLDLKKLVGRTLVNLLGRKGWNNLNGFYGWNNALLGLEDGYIKASIQISQTTKVAGVYTEVTDMLKENTCYLYVVEVNPNDNTVDSFIRVIDSIGDRYGKLNLTTGNELVTTYSHIKTGSNITNAYVYAKEDVVREDTDYIVAGKFRLYEIPQDVFDKIDKDPEFTGEKLVEKYPYCEGVQHLVNPYFIVKGENLCPSCSTWTFSGNQTIIDKDLVTIDVSSGDYGYVRLQLDPNTEYTCSADELTDDARIRISKDDNINIPSATYMANVWGTEPTTFTTPSDGKVILNLIRSASDKTGVKTLRNVMLVKGTEKKPHKPFKEQRLLVPTQLAEGEYLEEVAGAFVKNKEWESLVLDKSLSYEFVNNQVGYKQVRLIPCTNNSASTHSPKTTNLVKYNGDILKVDGAGSRPKDTYYLFGSDGTQYANYLYLAISNDDSGWGDAYTPSEEEIKAYFLGWKMYLEGTGGSTPYNGTGNKYWAKRQLGTSTLIDGQGNVPTVMNDKDFTPYELHYKLATPTVEVVPVEATKLEVNNAMEVEIDGRFSYTVTSNMSGYKDIQIKNLCDTVGGITALANETPTATATKYDGTNMNWGGNGSGADHYNNSFGHTYITVADADTGWGNEWNGETVPKQGLLTRDVTASELSKAYFNGWKWITGTVGWESILDDSITTGNVDKVISQKSHPDWTPYKVNYTLSTPRVVETPLEGALILEEGINQVEVKEGIIVKERINPYDAGTHSYVHSRANNGKPNHLIGDLINIYRNGITDIGWRYYDSDLANDWGVENAEILTEDLDTTAEYSITYVIMNNFPIALGECVEMESTILSAQLPNPNLSIDDVNIQYLRDKINQVRMLNGLDEIVWTDSVIIPKVTPVKAVHINELEDGLREVFNKKNIPIKSPEVEYALSVGDRVAHNRNYSVKNLINIFDLLVQGLTNS